MAVLDESATWFLPQARQMHTTSALHRDIHSAMHTLPAYTHTQSYPDVIAQCVYSTFIYAFPTSWNNFDDDFKNELCNTISLWQVGEQCNMALSMIQSDLTSCLGLQAHRWCLILGRNGT